MRGVRRAQPGRQRRLRGGRHPARERAVDVDRGVLAGQRLLESLERGHGSSPVSPSATACCAAEADMPASTRANAPLWAANALRRPTSASRSSASASAATARGPPGRHGRGTGRRRRHRRGDRRRGVRRRRRGGGDAGVLRHRLGEQVDVRLVGVPRRGQPRLQGRVTGDRRGDQVEHRLLVGEHGGGQRHVRVGVGGRCGGGVLARASVDTAGRAARERRGTARRDDAQRRTPGQGAARRDGGVHAPSVSSQPALKLTRRHCDFT